MITIFQNLSKQKGNSLILPAHGWVGARTTYIFVVHFALRNAKNKTGEKKDLKSGEVRKAKGQKEKGV